MVTDFQQVDKIPKTVSMRTTRKIKFPQSSISMLKTLQSERDARHSEHDALIPNPSGASLASSGRLKRITVIRKKKHRDGSVSVSRERMPVGTTVSQTVE